MAGRIAAEHLHRSVGPVPEAFQDLHRRGLPGAVGTEQGEHLAAIDVQVDASHRLDRRPCFIALDELPAFEGERHGADILCR